MADSDFARYSRKVIKYFYDPPPRNENPHTPILCLGTQYEAAHADTVASTTTLPAQAASSPPDSSTSFSRSTDAQSEFEEISKSQVEEATLQPQANEASTDDDTAWPSDFLDDYESRPWLTYRSAFPPIPSSSSASLSFAVRIGQLATNRDGFTTDTGWGCMIRSGQSLLANALLTLELGRSWRRGQQPETEKAILSLFADDPQAAFSIHKFVGHGASACGKYPGEWFGPSATAECIRALVNQRETSDLAVYVTGDGPDVYEDSVFEVAKGKTGSFRPTLILVGIRLGLERVTPVYWDALKSTLGMPQSAGIAGGRPSASHYFIGTQADDLFYLDPHCTRPALPFHKDPSLYTPEDMDSLHTRRLRKVNIREMDPSMLIGFLIKSETDWKDWRTRMAGIPGKAMIHIADKAPTLAGSSQERQSAIDEVESFTEEDDL